MQSVAQEEKLTVASFNSIKRTNFQYRMNLHYAIDIVLKFKVFQLRQAILTCSSILSTILISLVTNPSVKKRCFFFTDSDLAVTVL